MKGKRKAKLVKAEALALSAMIATMNVMPALADTTIPEIGIESTKEDESGERNLASSSNATPVEEDNIDKEIETEENEEDTEEDFEFEEELENDLETEESTENEEDTESSENEKESLGDSENESESSGAEESTEESTEDTESEKESSGDTENETEESLEDTENETEESTEDTESELETEEVDLEQVQVATPSNLEKPEELKPELMTLKEVVYGEWNDSEDGNWQFLPSEDGTCSIKPLSDAMKTGAVVIPEEVDGFTITSIGASAYESNINITSVVVPDSIKEIKEKAFKGTRITKFEANGVEKIETSAFNYCTGLITFNTHNAVELGDGVFTSCFSLKTVNIGASVIPFETFAHCEALTGFDFSNIEIIGERAFGWCEKLDTLELTNVKSIGEGAFTNCNFTSVDLTGIESIGNGAFGSNRELKTVKLTDVKNIGNYVFKNNKGITTLELTVIENIGNDAFSYCEGLTILKLTNVKSIGNQAFGHCEGLTTIELTDIESIGYRAFVSCTSLESVTLNNIGTIGDNTFQSCGGITDLNISNIGTIGDKAFLLCNSLITVNLNNVETIGVGAFQNLSSITSVTLDNVGTVGNSAFRSCTGLTELNIGSVGTIGGSAFANCTNLKTVDINEVSGTVKEYAFNNSGVETINIGSINNAEYNSLVATEKITIDYAENLGGAKAKNIEITSGNNVMCGNYWPVNYAGSSNNICETVTIGDVRGTVKAFAFNSVTIDSAENVIADADVINIKLADNILKVGGREVNIIKAGYLKNIADDDYENSWRINGLHEIEKLNIHHVGTIDDNCFERREKLNTVIIESAGTIGDEAFENCKVLSDLQIGTANKIGGLAFHYCRSLEKLETQDLGEIGDSAFIGTGLRTVNIGNVNRIGFGAFCSLDNLETVHMGNVKEIGEGAFVDNKVLTTVTMGEIHKMGARAFERCINLETMNWNCKIETLPENAFYYDGELKSIDLGSDLKTIEHKALFKCNSIKELTIPAGVDTVNVVDLCGEYDYSGEADFDNRGYTLIFLGDNTDFEIRYGEDNIAGDNDDSIIINELVLPSKDSKAYQRMTSLDNTDIVNKVGGGSKNVLYHAVVGYTKATYKDGVINGSSMLTPTSDGNMGKEVDWSWWSVYKDIGNEVGDSSNVGGLGTGRVIQHTIINAARIDNELIDGNTDNNKEKVTVRWFYQNTVVGEEPMEPKLIYSEVINKGSIPSTIPEVSENGGYRKGTVDGEVISISDIKSTPLEENTDFYIINRRESSNIENINVTFYRNDGTGVIWAFKTVDKGSHPGLGHISIPFRDGYEFTGWYLEPECINKASEDLIMNQDTDFYAKWEAIEGEEDNKEKITITYYLNDGTEDIFKREQIEKGDSPDMSVEPSRKGYEFTGWYYEAECENRVPDDITVEEDTDFYAGWEKKNTGGNGGSGGEIPDNPDDKKEPIKVTYYENDGTPDIYKTEKIEKGDTPDTSGEPEREGYEFIGWYEDPDCKIPVDPSKPLNEDTEYYAGWKKKDTDPSGNGSGSDKPEDDKKPDDKPDNKPEDKVEKVKVTYHTNDDTDKIYKEEEIEKGGTPDTEGNPDRDKYEFTGWYLDPECKVPVDPSKPLDEDTDLYAGWKKKDTIPTGNGSHGGGGSYSGGSSTVTVVNVHEDKPEPGRTTIGENGVPQGDTDKEEVNTYALDENGVPRDRAEEEKDKLPKTGDKRNILVYWITFMSSLSSIMFMGLKDKIRIRASKEKTENEIKH